MTGELISRDNVSTDLLRGLFDAALNDVSASSDGDLCVEASYKRWVSLVQAKQSVRYCAVFRFREQSELPLRLELANKINDEMVMIRAAISGQERSAIACGWINTSGSKAASRRRTCRLPSNGSSACSRRP
jgi:hypothetical protein